MSALLRLQDKAAMGGRTIFDEKSIERRSPQQKAKCTVRAQADMEASETKPGRIRGRDPHGRSAVPTYA